MEMQEVAKQRAQLLVLGLPVAEALTRGCKLAQLVPHHLVRDGKRDVVLAIVNEELEPAMSGCDECQLPDGVEQGCRLGWEPFRGEGGATQRRLER